MKAVAVGDLLLPASVFDETIRSASWVTAYDSFDWDVTKKRDELRNVVRRMETGGSRAFLPTQEELERLKDAEVILSHLFTIPREVFEAAPKLRYILSARGGVENIDLKAAHEHGVSVIHCPAHNAIAVAEYAIGLMIAESRNIARADRGLRSGTWIEKYPDSAAIPELRGSNVGIIGFGRIGQATGRIAAALGMRVLAHSPHESDEGRRIGTYVDLDTLLRESDVISLHCPLTKDNAELINRQTIAKMKDGALLVNNARGQLLNEQDVADALNSGKLAGAALDVVSAEPVHADNPLLSAKNCILTPHISWAPLESRQRIMDITAANIQAFLNGAPQNVVNK